ncbi:MAG: Na/Pi symporter, partial [Oscillospiraceae bacterium]|nr:Na/Pi symporter [Oscillospiraceae bacterium]
TAFKNPFLGLLAGTVVTGIIQSSAASVGILQAFAGGSGLTYGAAIPIIMGQNIGTCVTALISSIGVSKPAKRVAVVHIMFNVVGTLIYFVVIYGLNLIFRFAFLDNAISPFAIAIFHSIFNITVTAIIFPFAGLLEKLALFMVRDKQKDSTAALLLDERLLASPSLALTSCRDIILKMCDSAKAAVTEALALVNNYSETKTVSVRTQESMLDLCEDKLGTYLVKLSARDLTITESSQAAKFLRAIGDLERVGDHALNILQSAEELHDKKISFSQAAVADFERLTAALDEILVMTTDAFRENSESTAKQVEPLEQVVDLLVRNARDNHILRMQRGECGIEQGFVWNDILVNIERISDHCSNLALTVITLPDGAFSSHDYMRETRVESNTEFYYAFEHYRQKYGL